MLPYQNPQLDVEQRLDDLISRMTLDELIMQTEIGRASCRERV